MLGHLSDSHYMKYSFSISISIGSQERAMYNYEIKLLLQNLAQVGRKLALFLEVGFEIHIEERATNYIVAQ